MTRRRLCTAAVALASAALAAASTGAAASALSPGALYETLLTRSNALSELASTSAAAPTSTGRRHHIVGVVEISIDYGNDVILYAVFPTRADALAYWQDTDMAAQPGVTAELPTTGFPTPALMVDGSTSVSTALSNTPVTNGFTLLGFVDGNVSVAISTESAGASASGNLPTTLSLGRLALAELAALDAPLRPH